MLTVSQLNTYVKSLMDGDDHLNRVFVCGEISNFTNHYRTGHFYFSLKDENACIKAVMFRSAACRLRFTPENGLKVLVRGSVSVFERDGVYQLYAEDMQPDGTGALSLAFEQLKKKLEQKGYFEPEHKKAIPRIPEKIAVVTSPTGAALQDIRKVLMRRFPYAELILMPVQVQGSSAAGQIAQAIDEINRKNVADVMIVGRGGGSVEDLWAFNEEIVADAVYRSRIPVISAVGHEVDFTISDFTADLRAPTPSAAAELATPDTAGLLLEIDSIGMRARKAVERCIEQNEWLLSTRQSTLRTLNPSLRIDRQEQQCELLQNRLDLAFKNLIQQREEELKRLMIYIQTLNPLQVLTRGYALVSENEKTVTSVKKTSVGSTVQVKLIDGVLLCRVENIIDR